MTTLQPHSASLVTNPFCQCEDPDVRPVYALHIFECGNCLRGFENAPDWNTWWAEVAAFVGEPEERDSAPVHMRAVYRSMCPECDQPIDRGDPMVFSTLRKARHEACWVDR